MEHQTFVFMDLATYIHHHTSDNAVPHPDPGGSQRVEICGVLFLHSIKETRSTRTVKANLNFLKSLVGEEYYSGGFLVTTMWGSVAQTRSHDTGVDKFERRQQELEDLGVAGDVKQRGEDARFDGPATSVLQVIMQLRRPGKW